MLYATMADTLTITNIQFYKDIRDLLETFHKHPDEGYKNYLRSEIIRSGNTFERRPLRMYVWLLAQVNPIYRQDYLGTDFKEAEEVDKFFEIIEKFSENTKDWNYLDQEISKLENGEIDHPE